ncbi:hypothetical protein ABZ782_32635 [Streptomyces asoensis]|uniref:hypothetical protein n=1 Tax=Streptomyces asoensis TaxID=249586 RepID=UPI0033CF1C73
MDIDRYLGPGHRTTALVTSHGLRTADAAVRLAEVERFHGQREELAGRLTRRWGAPYHWGLQTVRLRTGTEEIPEPWAGLSLRADDVYLWRTDRVPRAAERATPSDRRPPADQGPPAERAPGTDPVGEYGRWVALGVADRDPYDEVRLLLVVTDTDPP